MKKSYNKKNEQELQEYLQFRHRGSVVEARKGKGSFKRNPKHKKSLEY